MEFLPVLMLGLVVLLGPLALAVIALVRSTRGLRRLEQRLQHVEGELQRVRAGSTAPAPATAEVPPTQAEPQPAPRVEPLVERATQRKPADDGWGSTAPKPSTPAPSAERAELVEPARARSRFADVDWERWIGLRGAALLGGVFLAFASLLLFQYSIQQGWITAEARVGMGVGAGVLGLVGSTLLHRKGYVSTANALAGGSAVALYASFWAAHSRYGFLSPWVWFSGMAAVTAVCCALAARRPSQVVAVLGLLGGFATPLLLGDAMGNAIGLFGYLLLVDLAFLFLARTRSWPSLGIVGIAGTALFETLWIGRDMRPEQFVLGLAVLGTFGILFALSGESGAKKGGRLRWMVSQAGGVLLPFLFAAYFAGRVDLGERLLPLAALAALLVAAASFLARRQRATWLPSGAASGAVAVLFVWSVASDVDGGRAWQLVGAALGLVGVLLAFGEWRSKEDEATARKLRAAQAFAAALAAVGFAVVLIGTGVRVKGLLPWPWLVGTVGLVLTLARASSLARRGALQLPGALALATVWISLVAAHGDRHDGYFPPPATVHFGLVVCALLFLVLALARRDERGRRWAWFAVVIYGLPAGFAIFAARPTIEAPLAIVLGANVLLATAMILASAAARSGALFALSALATAVLQTFWCGQGHYRLQNEDRLAAAWLVLFAVSAALVHAPFLARARFAERSAAWVAAAAVPWVTFFGLTTLFHQMFPERGIGLMPLLLALPSALAAWRAFGDDHALADAARSALQTKRRGIALAFPWYAVVAASLVSLALPMEVDRHVAQVALALFALATAWLWVLRDHLPLKLLSLGALSISTFATFISGISGGMRHDDALFWNDVSWATFVPALAAFGVVLALRGRELERMRRAEHTKPWGSALAGLACVALVFAWISLQIFNHYSAGQRVEVSLSRLQERDLSLSIAWAVYALILLVLGMRLHIGALRWVSLALFIITIAKVFLYDLASLEGLYRVGSMFGLAVSLLIVSLLYQRLVFRSSAREKATVT